ncbi:MAG TPA: hypothetical protein VGR37_21065 [Longimicrobiaceae bacterium]|nr:hypothetical protein [Longimicrobiaceae bacterium]
MHPFRRCPAVLGAALSFLFAACDGGPAEPAAPPSYTAVEFGRPDLGEFMPTALNDRGQVVGSGNRGVYRWEAGAFTRLEVPGSHDDPRYPFPAATVTDVNDLGNAVGLLNRREGLLWRGTTPVRFEIPLGSRPELFVRGINDREQVIGSIPGNDHTENAFIWTAGALRILHDTAGVADLNDAGDVVGTAYSWTTIPNAGTHKDHFRALLWRSDGRQVSLGTLSGRESIASAINERGQVAGTWLSSSGESRVFLWENGRMRDLGRPDVPPAIGAEWSVFVSGMNDRGEIVGTAVSGMYASESHPFVWRSGRFHKLEELLPDGRWDLLQALAINNSGTILVSARDVASGALVGLLLRPDA